MSKQNFNNQTIFETIPAELKLLPNWVCWRLERRLFESKATKIPYNPVTGEAAKANDPTTWTDYETCRAAVERGAYDGIGFEIAPPYFGVDLDKCRNPETGEVEEWAMDVVAHLDSYSEISPSETGLHVIGRGVLPPGRRREGRFEVYDSVRFLTKTGNHVVGTPLTIEERSDELAELHNAFFPGGEPEVRPFCEVRPNTLSDAEIIERAAKATNGSKFRKLWSGQWQGLYGSQNCADEALLCHLAFWTGKDENRMDILFRQSGLYRKKWDRQDYRRRTITSAINRTHEIYIIPRSERIERLYAGMALETGE